MTVLTFDVPELGNRSYIVHDGRQAIIIDPSRHSAQLISSLTENKLKLAAICETHIHNDYVTGGYQLASEMAVPYYLAEAEATTFEHLPSPLNSPLLIGKMTITALSTPGHTPHHISYLVQQQGELDALFSGGSILYGAVGRPDLISPEATPDLAHAQYQSAHQIAGSLAADTRLYPTHGFGSFCAATPTESVETSTLGSQLQTNQVFRASDADAFVAELLAGLDAYPAYYSYMPGFNLAGPKVVDKRLPQKLDVTKLMSLMHSGVKLIDLRTRTLFADYHLRNSLNIEASTQMAIYAGWIIDWHQPLILIAETVKQISEMQEQLSLIGRSGISGYTTSVVALSADKEHLSQYAVMDFKACLKAQAIDDGVIVDVRRTSETAAGHIAGAMCMPLHELSRNHQLLPNDKALYIHCASGFRASIGASLLDSLGYSVVLINDSFSEAINAGYDIKK